MGGGRRREGIFWAGSALNLCGLALLAAGAVLGWGFARVPAVTDALPALAASPASLHLDVSSFLGADITALAVIIAVVIGFNATALQIAGQAHSLAVVRGILFSLVPFLFCWVVTTGVALVYFLVPPAYSAQLWQMLLWFAAVVALVLGYLWDLPWRLSGGYVAAWAIRELRGRPLERWEPLDGYSALLSSIAAASGRGDVGTLRALTAPLASFLAGRLDVRAEREGVVTRERYRALKNLLSGGAQNAAQGPNSVAYYLGFILAGTIVQGAAIGLDFDDPERDMYSGLFRALRAAPERIDPLWTGMRHALCRAAVSERPLLLGYWRNHDGWADDDPRGVERIAGAIIRLQAAMRALVAPALERGDGATDDTSAMLADLYRDLAAHLAPTVARLRHAQERERLLTRCGALLGAIHTRVLAMFGLPASDPGVMALTQSYERYRAAIDELLAGGRR